MPTKVLRGNYSIWAALPGSGVNWASPSAAAIATAVTNGFIIDISCAVTDESGDSLNMTEPDTDDSQSICDIAAVETPTFDNYEAELDGFRNAPGTTDTPVYDTFFSLFNGVDREYWLIKRVDKQQGTTIAVDDIISAFRFRTDYPVDIVEDSGMILFGARFKQRGEMYLNRTVVA